MIFDPIEFDLLEKIGFGSYNCVFKALYKKTNEFFARKLYENINFEESSLLLQMSEEHKKLQ